ncbi:hypothetical protein BCV70DRAFT_215964 [Testicularia cyperi]|uniref:Fe2OG dioxygenase domain-containing protein n=1 Tax=Testicularia cyperi TaxID=1882483 RepID=A0A317XUB5_9BASI|nr:hypothetical protein BCV70DRAFT_215964 [Testicularia cyperi]
MHKSDLPVSVMSLLEEPAQSSWDLSAHRIAIPDAARPKLSSSTQPSDARAANADAEEGGFFYIPNFITADEEQYLIESIQGAPKPKWKTLQKRRLQEWGGQVSAKNTLIPQTMPHFFARYPDLISRLKATGAFDKARHGEPNHCLVNEYLPGQGIMPHEDGSAYFPAVATISLASHTLLDIYRYVDEDLQKDFDHRMEQFDRQSNGSDTQSADGSDPQKSRIVPKERIEGDVKIVRGARAREPDPVFSILQEPRSLLITTGSVYKDYLHGIAERTSDDAAKLAKVINTDMVQDAALRDTVKQAQNGDSQAELTRDTRLSFTFRDVENVSKGAGAMLAFLSGGGGTGAGASTSKR